MSTELVPISAEIARRESEDWMPVLTMEEAIARKQAITAFVAKLMVADSDYGIIPGTKKPTLLKPGAEKLCSYFGLVARYTANSVTRDWTGSEHGGEPFFEFDYKCQLVRMNRPDSIVGEGDGSCNSWEKKYRYQETARLCPKCNAPSIIKGKQEYGGGWLCFAKKGGCGAKFTDKDPAIIGQVIGRTPNPDVFDQVNTFEKMAQKRALIAATLNAVNASEFFTQDMEDAGNRDTGSAQESQAVADYKIEQMKQGRDYRDMSQPDPRKDRGNDWKDQAIKVAEEALSDLHTFTPDPPPPPDMPVGFSIAKSCAEFAKLKQYAVDKLGDKGTGIYYRVLGLHGAEHANELKFAKPARDCYRQLAMEIEQAIKYKQGSDAFDQHMTAEK